MSVIHIYGMSTGSIGKDGIDGRKFLFCMEYGRLRCSPKADHIVDE